MNQCRASVGQSGAYAEKYRYVAELKRRRRRSRSARDRVDMPDLAAGDQFAVAGDDGVAEEAAGPR